MAQYVCKTTPPEAVSETLDQLLDGIDTDQESVREINKRIKERKAAAKDAIRALGVKKYENPSGVTGVFYDTNRTNADKKEAERRVADEDCWMTSEDFQAIFKVNTTENFKVKKG